MQNADPFIPNLATLDDIVDLTPDVKLFSVKLKDPAARQAFDYQPGQFGFLSAFGVGEGPFGITSVSYSQENLDFAIRKVGTVTRALHDLEKGAVVGFRGPFGNFFPMAEYRGKNIFIIGGGIGFAPLRPVITYIMDHRAEYGSVQIINGARSPSDLVFKSEFDAWRSAPDTHLELTVDRKDDTWTGRVALIPDVVTELKPSPQNTVAIICGPPIMIKFTLERLAKLGFGNEQIVTTLESKMKCGMGKCARCNVGDKYVCRNGPVFTLAQITGFLEQF